MVLAMASAGAWVQAGAKGWAQERVVEMAPGQSRAAAEARRLMGQTQGTCSERFEVR